MVFTSIDFLIFFSALFALYFFIPHRFKWFFLLAASLYFYSRAGNALLIFLVVPITIVYFLALKISRTPPEGRKKLLLVTGLCIALAGLIVFRYTNFIGSTLFAIAGLFSTGLKYEPLNLIFPIGLSFYSFKMVSYLVDVYNDNAPAEKHFGYFALYVSFFPQILAGPIDRAVKFIPELKQKVNFDFERILSGFRLAVWGVFKKMVVADRLDIFVDQVFANPEGQGINILFGAYFFAFQIYCDFSGYSDMAIGVSRMLGFKSMDNFNFPYFAVSMTQFWNRWHISLSTWLRDYLFLPIAYAVMRPIKTAKWHGMKTETLGYAVGMFLTMFLGGLWHGPTWTFVIWGGLHGIFLIVGYTSKKKRKKLRKKLGMKRYPKLRDFLSIICTFHLVTFAWIFFRSPSFGDAVKFLSHMQLRFTGKATGYLIFNLLIVGLFILLEIFYKNREKSNWLRRIPVPVKWSVYALYICFIIIFAVDTSNEFIYTGF